MTWFAETLQSNKTHTRVANGALILKRPTSLVGYYQMYSEMVSFSKTPDALSSIFWHFLLLIYCQIGQWNDPYCYNNVFADLALKNGTGEATGIYKYVDVFTWEGFFIMLLFGYMHNALINFLTTTLVSIGFVLVFGLDPSLTFCKTGELGDLFGSDVCSWVFFNQ